MSLKEMNALVRDELKHIPDWPEPQNFLRMAYAALRKNSLGKKARGVKTREQVLRESIDSVKQSNPDWSPQYDREYFKM